MMMTMIKLLSVGTCQWWHVGKKLCDCALSRKNA